MKTTVIPALMALALLGGTASQADARMSMPSFEALDADNSGQITQEQFEAIWEAPRDRMIAHLMEQANEDGLLDEDALRAGLETLSMGARGQRADDRGARLFSRIDSNGDGVIDAGEYARFTARMEERGSPRHRMRSRD